MWSVTTISSYCMLNEEDVSYSSCPCEQCKLFLWVTCTQTSLVMCYQKVLCKVMLLTAWTDRTSAFCVPVHGQLDQCRGIAKIKRELWVLTFLAKGNASAIFLYFPSQVAVISELFYCTDRLVFIKSPSWEWWVMPLMANCKRLQL